MATGLGDESSLTGLCLTLSPGCVSHSHRNASNGLGQALQVESSPHRGQLLNPFLLVFGSQSRASRRLMTRLSLLATSQAKGLAKIVPDSPGQLC